MQSIIFENIVKEYPGIKALNNISFEVKPNRIHGFLGSNGAGKSTSMNILCCLLKQSSGNVIVNGFDTLKNPEKVKTQLGYLPENPPLYLEMRVEDYLFFVTSLYKIPKAEASKSIDYILERVGLKDLRKRFIGHLSKGQKQRVGIAQAMVFSPNFLVLDEPVVGLDPKAILEIRQLILDLKNDHTIFLSTHQLGEVEQICDDITVINKGEIILSDTLDKVVDRFNENQKLFFEVKGDEAKMKSIFEGLGEQIEYDMKYVGKINQYEIKVDLKGDESLRNTISKKLVNDDLDLVSLYTHKAELEDIFLKITESQSQSL